MNYKEWFYYDPSSPSGLRWKKRKAGKSQPNGVAGNVEPSGYWVVFLDGKKKYLHRIIWELENGPIPEKMEIDHKDRNRGNNRLDNLRLATSSQNKRNRSSRASSGYKGVYPMKGRWQARVQIDGKFKVIANCETAKEAALHYDLYEAKRLVDNEFKLLNFPIIKSIVSFNKETTIDQIKAIGSINE